MTVETILQKTISDAILSLYSESIDQKGIILQNTKKEFNGDFTLVVFPYAKMAKKNPEQAANEIGEYVKRELPVVSDFNVIKGFLNFSVSDEYWRQFFSDNFSNVDFGIQSERKEAPVVVEYSSPNTNKPLHLGHIRNNLLGWSISEILKANGYCVKKVNLVNDRGIHICKSMVAWLHFGHGETPESSGMKGDHLVGKYYVLFDKHYKKEINDLLANGMSKEEAEKKAPILQEAQEVLRKWEAKDEETLALWRKMNAWVYDGFDKTYAKMGVDFDKIYYESDTYLLGKDIIKEGLQKGVLIQKADNSVWADLTPDGLDEKLLLRSDGTSVYMTQDLGTALLRHNDFDAERLIYVVGNEQNYHFEVLRLVMKKLGYEWAEKIYHLSYGMVELPEGKMKSREGTVVDADDLIDEMIDTARKISEEHGKTSAFEKEEAEHLYNILAMGALKYFILKVDPVKNMLFNPKESIDFNGNTGPFIQYTHARICSIIRKAAEKNISIEKLEQFPIIDLSAKEKNLIKILYAFPNILKQAGENYSPALLANYVYDLAKEFNGFYQDTSILHETTELQIILRVSLCRFVGNVIKTSMKLLGIEVPERM